MPVIGRLRYIEAAAAGTERPRGTLLLIHAFPLNARMWEPQLALADERLARHRATLRGVDGGGADPPATSMDDYAADVIDLLDALHIEEAVVGGLSMGGYVAFAMLRHAPRYVQGLDPRRHAAAGRHAGRRRRAQEDARSCVREKGPAAVADEMIPKLLGEHHAPNAAGGRRSRARRSSCRTPPTRSPAPSRALMTRPDSTPLLVDDSLSRR